MPPSKQVMLKKKGKRKSKKTTTIKRGGTKIINNIHINSKSGTRSKTQRRGGVGGSVAPSGASTISHVPLVMNVPAPDSTQRETQYLHAIQGVQSDILALKQASIQLALGQQGPPPSPDTRLQFQPEPSVANQDVRDEAKRAHSTPPSRGRGTTPRPLSLPPPPKEEPRSTQGVGVKGSNLPGQSTLAAPVAEHSPILKGGGQAPTPAKKKGRKTNAQKQAEKVAEDVEEGKQKKIDEFKK
tara:strand:+ start:39 stop:761 length:723 start_codon:yes stop_codon:yes gene_type:complete